MPGIVFGTMHAIYKVTNSSYEKNHTSKPVNAIALLCAGFYHFKISQAYKD
jgi:hypothetical protein